MHFVVSDSMNQRLLVNFIDTKIKTVVFRMKGLRTPGPNGFFAYFFQKNWAIVESDVFNYVREVLNFRISLEEVNSTFITMIPKVANPKRV